MAQPSDIDGVLVEWGDRLFYPGNRRVRSGEKLSAASRSRRAAAIRARIAATFVRRAPQVIVKVSGGGRGMKAIAAHFRYISKNGRLSMEDEREQLVLGKDAVREVADDWRYGGALIEDESFRREAFNIILSMPDGTNAEMVRKASREFARQEFNDHKYVMVLHDHQANPHVHLSVRGESIHGRRLNPRKEDLRRWRETFAEKLRGWGIEADASGQACRGVRRRYPDIWLLKAEDEGRLRRTMPTSGQGHALATSSLAENAAWKQIAGVLASSPVADDQRLAREVISYFQQTVDAASPLRGLAKTEDRAR